MSIISSLFIVDVISLFTLPRQTGSGKTHTMGTAIANTKSELDQSAGIVARACLDVFSTIETKCVDGKATVSLSFLEVYNEEIRDLLGNKGRKELGQKHLRLRDGPNGSVQIQGCVKKVVHSPSEIGILMEVASKRRVVAATRMNAISSRSHAICILNIRGCVKDGKENKKFSSKLYLVDLAGSERMKKTGAEGARQTEGMNVNKSLLVLGQVVSALSKGSRRPPYRDSKLTRLLQSSLGGNSRTIMVACVSPAESSVDETTNTLRYASSARRITNHVRQNMNQSPIITAEYAVTVKQENSRLKVENDDLRSTIQKLQQQLQEQATTQRKFFTASTSQNQTTSTASMSFDEMDSQPTNGVDDLVPEQIKVESSYEASSDTDKIKPQFLANQNASSTESSDIDFTLKL